MNYGDMVTRLAKKPAEIYLSQTTKTAELTHCALGIAGEAGEIVDAIKKYAIYGKHLDRANLIEELGDMEFYMEMTRQALKVTREDVLQCNVDKLSKRYPQSTYSDAAAIAREDKQNA